MQSHDAAAPIEWEVRKLRSVMLEWGTIASQIVEHLYDEVDLGRPTNWRPHAAQIAKAVQAFSDRCSEEASALGSWRGDGLQPDEIYAIVWDEADQLAKWLNRMMQQ